MKKTLLVCAAALAFTSCSSVPSKNTDNDLTPVQITEISSGSFPKRQFDNESDKTRYSEGDLCVLINCCCGKSKYNWLFSKQYFIVDDGGDCYWKMFINLDKGLLISYYINGEA